LVSKEVGRPLRETISRKGGIEMRKITLVVLCVVLLVGMSSPGHGGEKPVAIGKLLPLTGDLAEFSALLLASNLAVNHVNSAGGPLDMPLKLLVADTGTVPDQGVAAARKLINIDRVPAISGPVASAVAMAMAPLLVQNKVLLVADAATTPLLSEYKDDDFIFRTSTTDALQGRAIALLAKEKGYKKISILARNDTFGRSLAKVLEDGFKSLGGNVLRTVFYELGQSSFKAELVKAAEGNPDRISLVIFPEEGVTIIRQAVDLGVTNFGLIPDSAKSQEMFDKIGKAVGKGKIEGISGVAGATPTGVGIERFNALFKEKYGHEAYVFSTNAYDSVFLIALAIQKAGEATPTSGPAIRDALREIANPPGEVVTVNEFGKAKELLKQGKDINYEGASGSLDYDENGDVYAPVGVWEIKDASVKEVRLYTVGDLKKIGK
jgi:branched-chain amino acid transport system substrate-binding protein